MTLTLFHNQCRDHSHVCVLADAYFWPPVNGAFLSFITPKWITSVAMVAHSWRDGIHQAFFVCAQSDHHKKKDWCCTVQILTHLVFPAENPDCWCLCVTLENTILECKTVKKAEWKCFAWEWRMERNGRGWGRHEELKGSCWDGWLLSREAAGREAENRIQTDGIGWMFSDT